MRVVVQKQTNPEIIMLGVDPGFSITGYAVARRYEGRTTLIAYGSLRMSSKHTLIERTGQFYSFFLEKITGLGVTHLALETSFLGKNPQTFLKLGYLRGILYLLASQHQLPLTEFAPMQVKMAVTGYGGARKEQVEQMVLQLFPRFSSATVKPPATLDTTDAIAICLTGLWQEAQKALASRNS